MIFLKNCFIYYGRKNFLLPLKILFFSFENLGLTLRNTVVQRSVSISYLILSLDCCCSWKKRSHQVEKIERKKWPCWLNHGTIFSIPSISYAKIVVEIWTVNFHLPWCQLFLQTDQVINFYIFNKWVQNPLKLWICLATNSQSFFWEAVTFSPTVRTSLSPWRDRITE